MNRQSLLVIAVMLASVRLSFAGWSLTTYPSGATPGGTFGTGGSCESNVVGSIELRYRSDGSGIGQFICSHTINKEVTIWDQEFDPTVDYNPPGTWPDTQPPEARDLLLRLVVGSQEIALQSFECDEIE